MGTHVPCVAWIPRARAKRSPDKVELSTEELQELIDGASTRNESLRGTERDAEEDESMDDVAGASGGNGDDELAEYDLDNYDDGPVYMDSLAGLAVYSNNTDDPYITLKDTDMDDREDFEIKDTDNLLLASRVHGDECSLEVYVYNEDDDCLYVHRDISLSSYPLCLESLTFDPTSGSTGCLVAVGTLDPVVDIWDLDMVGSLEPAFSLGKKKRRKKKVKKTMKQKQGNASNEGMPDGEGHTDAVLDLAWNPLVGTVLASASADHSVLLWDLKQGRQAGKLTHHTDKVQTLSWHPFEAQTLLSGSYDRRVMLYDCRSPTENHRFWTFSGEIEHVIWNHFSPFYCLASTEDGFVYCMDVRADKPVFTLRAHDESITGMELSSQVRGCLVTASNDRHIKVWDILEQRPRLVLSRDMKMGMLYCGVCNPDSPFVMAFGGQKGGVRVLDLMTNPSVRNAFGSRERLLMKTPVDSGSEPPPRRPQHEMSRIGVD